VIVKAKLSRLRQTRWWEYLVRFGFGGIVTVITGLIAKKWGPEVAGLFLAFPGIFPAGVTLVERHEREKKHKQGLSGTRRGRAVSAVVSAGAVLGSVGLLAFAALAWWMLPQFATGQALAASTVGCFVLALAASWVRLRF
jgi:hypothetical protein